MDKALYFGEELYSWIRKRGDALKKVIEQKEKELLQYPTNIPQGTITAAYNGETHKREQYFLRERGSRKTAKYVRKTPENERILKIMIQREYDQKLLKAAKDEYKYLQAGTRFLTGDCFRQAYDSMGLLKQKWVLPVLMMDDEYLKEWQEKVFVATQYKKENQLFATKRGETVRSKSELIIANTLFEKHIPYRYECPLEDHNRIWALPDFTVLNVKKRKEYYWEHFGMMGDSGYVSSALKKIRTYEKHHMFPGTEMIYTFESSDVPVDIESIEEIIQNYFV